MKTGQQILVVDDEPKIRQGLRDFLEFHDFLVTEADDGLMADQTVSTDQFDLILLDLMLPHISGEQLCRKWRQQGLRTPIIMLTAKGQEAQKVAGLDIGADDYITKPFSLEELLARMRAILRRLDPMRCVGQTFNFGPLTVNTEKMKLINGSDEYELTPRHAKMLVLFAGNPNRVISRQELYRKVWNESMDGIETRTVDMHIVRLRELLTEAGTKTDLIQTVRGAGYKYEYKA